MTFDTTSEIPNSVYPPLNVLASYLLDKEIGIRRALRGRSTEELYEYMELLGDLQSKRPEIFPRLGLEAPEKWSLGWEDLLEDLNTEIERRAKPESTPGPMSPLAQLKRIPLLTAASKFTDLRPAGPGKMKGLCPLHQEKTASFYVYEDREKWRCFGACSTGGDVVDLLERLQISGRLHA